jgi:hypothetical protein
MLYCLPICLFKCASTPSKIILKGVVQMFEVKKNESQNKTIRMPFELIKELEQVATKKDVSFSQLVIQCCEYALKNIKDK